MSHLPVSPSLEFLRKEAKQLLRKARAGDHPALDRFSRALPGLLDVPAAIQTQALHLHDAQSVVAREHGFRSWIELKHTVEWLQSDHAERLARWLHWIYDGGPLERQTAARLVSQGSTPFHRDIWVAAAAGNVEILSHALDTRPALLATGRNPMGMPLLIAVTHSWLLADEQFAPGLLKCAHLLLDRGADPNIRWTNPSYPDWPLSPLYGAAGKLHHPELVRLLLAAGAAPDDNESLYHSVEARDSTCTRILLDAGARVKGTNAIGRVLDYHKANDLAAMLAHGADVREGFPVHHAILRGCPIDMIRLLIDAGADLGAVNRDGVSLYRFATLFGREDVAALLRARGMEESLSSDERFVAACAASDAGAVRAMLDEVPDRIKRLSPQILQTMPQLAAIGCTEAVRTMLEAGWPREVRFAWDATALNHAIYRGDVVMTALLLDHGADWRTPHGFGDNAIGTLAWTS